MTQLNDKIQLNKDSKSFETIDLRGEVEKGGYDFKPLLKRIEEYEELGWELVSNIVYTSSTGIQVPRNYVLMRRKK